MLGGLEGCVRQSLVLLSFGEAEPPTEAVGVSEVQRVEVNGRFCCCLLGEQLSAVHQAHLHTQHNTNYGYVGEHRSIVNTLADSPTTVLPCTINIFIHCYKNR